MQQRIDRMEDLPPKQTPPAEQPETVEQQQQGQPEANRLPVPISSVQAVSLAERAKYGAGAILGVGGVAEVIGMGGTGVLLALLAGGTAAYFSEEIRGMLIDAIPAPKSYKSRWSKLNWLLTGQRALTPIEQREEMSQIDTLPLDQVNQGQGEEFDLYRAASPEEQSNGVRRLEINEIVKRVIPNSYRIYIGRSLTKPGNPAVLINVYKQHFKFIGASQHGKSAMAAAFLEIVTRTHDPAHVLVALLDYEDQTSKLFANVPHLAEVTIKDPDGALRNVPLHATTREQVVEYLNYIVSVLDYRYGMGKHEILKQPILLVYVEEFLQLKKYLRKMIDSAKDEEEKKLAKKRYADFSFAISEIASRGLKARVQLLLCAQVDYRDEDKELQEALINVGCGMSFCVRTTAAQAAGFYNYDLLLRNALEDKVGQAVVEMPDCKDLVLAPNYPLEQRILDLEEEEPDLGQPMTSRRTDGQGYLSPKGDRQQTKQSAPAESQGPAVTTKLEETLEQILAKLAIVEAGGENRFQGRDTDPDGGQPPAPSKYKRALEVWISNDGNNGNFSVSAFAKAMDNMDRTAAYRLLVEMEEKGMIDRPKREKAEK
jgi:hypothetical protein